MGAPGVGKTTCREAFKLVWEHEVGKRLRVITLNPLVMTLDELFGCVTRGKWVDGTLSSILRQMALDAEKRPTWLVFDLDG